MARSGSGEAAGRRTVPRLAVLAILALSFGVSQPPIWGSGWCEWGSSPICTASIDAAELMGVVFPFGFAALALVFAPINTAFKVGIIAALGVGVAYAGWRRLPPRLTLKQFAVLVAGWLALSVGTVLLGLLLVALTAKFMFP